MNKFLLFAFLTLFLACNKDPNKNDGDSLSDQNEALFTLLKAQETGVDFSNALVENDHYNYLNYEAMYNGAGVAVIDINNDGLEDLFFTSNQGPDRLFLNQGNMRFKDISGQAGIEGGKEFSSGICVADVNGDGYEDLYVCNHLIDTVEMRRNKLYINNRDGTFSERAQEYGVDDSGYGIGASFFDYDLDGDLDLFVVNQPPNQTEVRNRLKGYNYQYSSHLYENIGDKFKDVTSEAGLIYTGYSLSVAISDISNDGWPDIYITNDYSIPDMLFINNQKKQFINVASQSMQHLSNFSMGCDVADINNDGWLDVFVADMAAEDHYRNKANMAGMNPKLFWEVVHAGFHHQYMFNTLHLNRGNGLFSEISQLSGVSKTDWSWAALFADYDNDGLKDLYVTNGLKRDVRNRDFEIFKSDYLKNRNNPSYKGERFERATELLDRAPSVKIANYMYKNTGDYHMKNMSVQWGLSQPSFSHGAAYADLDNDGDLDMVVNNMDDPAFIYRNDLNTNVNRYLRIKCKGTDKNSRGIGARAIVYTGNQFQIGELYNSRGYMSCSEPVLHFGLGALKTIDSLIVRWPNGKAIKMENVKTNQVLELDITKANLQLDPFFHQAQKQYTSELEENPLADVRHQENTFDDYRREILLPHQMSTLGPCLVVADINKDGLDDFYLGGSIGNPGKLLIQKNDGGFSLKHGPWEKYKNSDDGDVVFEDIDGDGDLDFIVGPGGNEHPKGSVHYQTKLFLNTGNGLFNDATSTLPEIRISTGLIKVFDMDQDGDKDIFIGGRQVPGFYGLSAPSKMIIQESGKFIDQTEKRCPAMNDAFGMVACGAYTDINRDGSLDLILAGEWMKITVMINDGKGYFTDQSAQWGTDSTYGWWNSIVAVDYDQDGDPDLLAGNAGTNLKFKASQNKPFNVYLNDFDQNGSWDTYLASYDADGKIYPVRGRQCSSEQMPFIKEKFKNYESFAHATVQEILEGKLDHSQNKFVLNFESGIFINENKQKFNFKSFPTECQFSPIQDFVIYDFNKDQTLDFAYAGNYHNREVETIRSDAGIGGICLGNSKKTFSSVHSSEAGMYLNGDCRKIKLIKINNQNYLLSAFNNGPLKLNLIK